MTPWNNVHNGQVFTLAKCLQQLHVYAGLGWRNERY